MVMLLRLLAPLAAFLWVLFAARPASACAVCGAADKTLPAKGEEIGFAGRVRVTLDGRAAAFAARFTPLRVTEMRLVPGLAVAIGGGGGATASDRSDPVLVSVDAPILRRSLSLDGAASDRWMIGDVEGRVSWVAYRSRSRRLAVHGGIKAPTAPLERDPAGAMVPTDLQPGCGAIAPLVSATYTWTSTLVTAWTTATLLFPVAVRAGLHPGDSPRASTTIQLQPARVFATRLGVHGRLDAAGDRDGEVDAQSGGASVFVSPELVVSPVSDLVVSVGAAFPIVQETRGHRVTAPIALVGVGWDF